MSKPENVPASNFIRNIIKSDVAAGKNQGNVVTRFPPEPNGYLHIGHAISICLNFGMALEHGGKCYLRFDDTNPSKESPTYIEAIQRDVRWLGFDWEDRLRFASNYFEQLYDYAIQLIKKDKAYVCSLTAEEIREYRGTLQQAGKNSPYRHRSIEENLTLFAQMRAGEFEDGTHVLRAKIDMASPNINLRDPTLYRIRKITHHQTGNEWPIYPMYDFTHCLSDSIEGVTHSLCTLEFKDHRLLYDWFLDALQTECHPQQIEFSRFSMEYMVTSKRQLTELVQKNHVQGWDDPRMPTMAGLKRRGYTPESIRTLCERVGISKNESVTEMYILEDCIRQDLEAKVPRVLGVLRPLRVVIENYPKDQTEELQAKFHPNQEGMGQRILPFTKEIYIDCHDFMEEPPAGYRRLSLGKEVRLRYGYVIRCEAVIKDEQTGEVVELRCSYDPNTLGTRPEGRKVKGVIHWVSVPDCLKAEVRLYDRLFTKANPNNEDFDFKMCLNPHSLETVTAYVEPSLKNAKREERYQFEREGYFYVDPLDSTENAPVFNRIATLRDSWKK